MTAGGWNVRRTPRSDETRIPAELATSFDLRAADYARLRPGYPVAAVTAAVPAGAATVLDLAAGTGKLTEPLLDLGYDVVAVEPLPGMLSELHRRYPAAPAVAGTAENLPLVDGAVDAVVVGQAFHWFDRDRALDEIARVLRPGGSLALVWNHDDETDALQHTYSYVIRATDALRAQLDAELPTIIRDHVGDARIVPVPVICQVWRSTCR